jgi:hypothetical protein
MDADLVGKGLSTLGKGIGPAFIAKAKELGVQLPAEADDPNGIPPRMIIIVLHQIAGHFFPLLATPAARS